jgi:hypothetical protein
MNFSIVEHFNQEGSNNFQIAELQSSRIAGTIVIDRSREAENSRLLVALLFHLARILSGTVSSAEVFRVYGRF